MVENIREESQRICLSNKELLFFKNYLLDGVEPPYVFVALLVAKKKYSKNPQFPSRLTVRSWVVRDFPRFIDEEVYSLKFPIRYKGIDVRVDECILYITTNPRDPRRAVKLLAEESINLLYGNDIKAMSRLDRLVISAYMKSAFTKERFFIDVDLKESNFVDDVLSVFKGIFGEKIQLVVKTRGGLHLHFRRSLLSGKELGYIFRKEFLKDISKEIIDLVTEVDVKSDSLCAIPGLKYGENKVEILF